jgi:hypothetical protein
MSVAVLFNLMPLDMKPGRRIYDLAIDGSERGLWD